MSENKEYAVIVSLDSIVFKRTKNYLFTAVIRDVVKIWLRENVGKHAPNLKYCDDTNPWRKERGPGNARTFYFKDRKHALMFKLIFGG